MQKLDPRGAPVPAITMHEQHVRADDGVDLRVLGCGAGRDLLVLSGGPGLVNYLADERLVPEGLRAWFPDPRGVGGSGGGPHSMARAVADLEALRTGLGVPRWTVLGHSWGSDLAVRYAVTHPEAVVRVVGVAGHGLHKDRTWSEAYHAGEPTEPDLGIAWSEPVWRALNDSFLDWVHEPGLWRSVADCDVPVHLLVAGDDIRPPWPLHQLAATFPNGRCETLRGVPHDFWSTHPSTWRDAVTAACRP